MEDEETQYAIRVNNAFMSYGKDNVINGLHMNVPPGSIYGLLGASGCGKSTILQCILGKMTLDSGIIYLKADCLSDIGYMPQDLCLEDNLTIKEIFKYYGTLYNLTKEQIECKIETLQKFLNLPDLNKFIKNISGGQSRRVSLAVSILHDPKIIILDEPTVGIDPLLRQTIWEEFSRMVEQNKKTIVITTHYIEEATNADCIGFMRNGVIIEEGAPQNILTKYETNSLESAFLTLCCKRVENRIAHDDIQNIQQREIVETQNKHFAKSGKSINFIRIKALIKKNTNVISRDYMLLMILFVLPIVQSLNANFSIGQNFKGVQIAVKNDEINSLNCQHSVIKGCILDEASNQTMSCVVMNYLLSLDYQFIEVKDYNAGKTMVKNYESLAFLYFPQNYTKELSIYVGENRENYDFESSIHMYLARDNLLMKNQVLREVTDVVKDVIEKTLNGCFKNPKALSIPLGFDVVLGKEVKSYINYGIALAIAAGGFFITSAFSVSLMLAEKCDGLLGRSMFAGVTIMELLISLFCISTVLFIVQMAIPLFIAYVCFSNPILVTGSLFVYFFMLLLLGWIGFFYGITIAVLIPSKLGGVYATNGLFMSYFMLSGFIWPIEGQLPWMRMVSELLPTSLAGRTMNDVALRGWTWDHPSVMYSTILMVIQIVLLILLLFGLDKIKKDMWVLKK